MRRNRLLNPQRIAKKLIEVIDVLIEEGYLEGTTGYFSTRWYSKCSLITPLEKIEHVFSAHALTTAKIGKSRHAPLVVVKNDKKEVIHYPRGKTVTEMEKKISTINDLLRRTDIRLTAETTLPPNVCPDDIALHRVFNNSTLNNGGRFYGGFWQQLSSEKRSRILLNGEATEELDFSGQHIGLLYAALGYEMPNELRKDPYGCKQESIFPRKLLKMAVLTAINSNGLTQAWRGTIGGLRPKKETQETEAAVKEKALFRKLIRTENDYKALIEEFLTVHPLLREGVYKGWGLRLMRLDSEIADYILQVMARKEIPVLPVHDSFIVQKRYKDVLLAAMKAAYLESSNPVLQKAYTSIKDGTKTIYSFKTS